MIITTRLNAGSRPKDVCFDEDMLRHLKKCMLFLAKPNLKIHMVNNLVANTEGVEHTILKEVEVVGPALQSFG
jgi:hypothetical protein